MTTATPTPVSDREPTTEVAERIRRSATSDLPFRIALRVVAAFFGAVVVLFVWSIVKTAWPAITSQGIHLITGKTWIAGTGPYGGSR